MHQANYFTGIISVCDFRQKISNILRDQVISVRTKVLEPLNKRWVVICTLSPPPPQCAPLGTRLDEEIGGAKPVLSVVYETTMKYIYNNLLLYHVIYAYIYGIILECHATTFATTARIWSFVD